MSAFNTITKTALGLFVAAGMLACDKSEPGGGGVIKPEPTVSTHKLSPELNSLTYNQADSSFIFWQKVYGKTASEPDKIMQISLSASKNAKGDAVSFQNTMITEGNIKESSGNFIALRDYKAGALVISAGNKNIGSTTDGLDKVKSAEFTNLTSEVYLKNASNAQQVMGVLNNPGLTWKMTGKEATGYSATPIKFVVN